MESSYLIQLENKAPIVLPLKRINYIFDLTFQFRNVKNHTTTNSIEFRRNMVFLAPSVGVQSG